MIRSTISAPWRAATLAAALMVCQRPAAHAQLPEARTLIARYNTAVGGDAMMQHRSSHATGTFEMPVAGLSGTVEIFRSQPNRTTMKVTVPAVGEILNGYDGMNAWSMNPMEGPRLLTGREADQLIEDASVGASLRRPEFVTSMTTVEKTEMAGKSCYRVQLVWKSGRTSHDCYDTDTGLLVASVSPHETSQGEVEVTSVFADYRDFGGVKLAAKVTQSFANQEQVLTITSMEFDTINDEVYSLPPAVRALTQKK